MSRGASAVADRFEYRSWISDNRRWDALALREGDIVISAPSKCGVTWTQRLVSLLIFDGPRLPGPLSLVSPWLDRTVRPIEEVVAGLEAQRHRRFIKTHTPLDGLVLDDRVTYLGVGRDPRDAAMSELAQWDNMNHSTLNRSPEAAGTPRDRSPHEAFRDWLEGPIVPPDRPGFLPPAKHMGSLSNILHHFWTVWSRRHQPNVAMFHYLDLQTDLVGELVRLGHALGYQLSRERAAELAEHARLDEMRSHASALAPEATEGIWRSNERFFRAGSRGEWRHFFDDAVYRRYYDRINQLAPPNLLAWAHEGRQGCDPAA